MQTEFQLVEIEARFQAKQAELQQAKAQAVESDSSLVSNERVNTQLRERIVEEFKRDPDVASLIDQIRSTTEELDHTKGVVKKGHDPARLAAERRLTNSRSSTMTSGDPRVSRSARRLLVPTGAPGAPEVDSLTEMKSKIDELKIRKTRLTDLVNKYDSDKQLSQTDAVKATFARDELTRLQNMHDQVNRKLESLNFTQDKAAINIEDTTPAQTPKVSLQ